MSGEADDVELFGHWICPYSIRVSFALAQRGIDHDVTVIPPSGVRPRDFELPGEFLRQSPRREIPLLRIGSDYLVNSIPILKWLEVRFTERSMLPGGPLDLEVARRMDWIDSTIYPAMAGVYYGHEPVRIEQSSMRLEEALVEMENWLTGGDWLCGPQPSLAEAVIIPLYVRFEGLRHLGYTGTIPGRIEGHVERCRGLAGWSSVEWSDDQMGEFVGRFSSYRRSMNSSS